MSTCHLTRLSRLVLAFGVLLVAGCGETDCYVVAKDSHGIREKAPVVWQDAYVGQVSAVESMAGGAKVSLGIRNEFAERIHAGVTARIVSDARISYLPFVLLVGGKDASMPLVQDGSQIPEASPADEIKNGFAGFMQWLSGSSHTGEKTGGGVLLVLLVILKFVKRLVKLLVKLLILAVLVGIAFCAKQDWSVYRERLSASAGQFESVQTWLKDNAEPLKKLIQQAAPVE